MALAAYTHRISHQLWQSCALNPRVANTLTTGNRSYGIDKGNNSNITKFCLKKGPVPSLIDAPVQKNKEQTLLSFNSLHEMKNSISHYICQRNVQLACGTPLNHFSICHKADVSSFTVTQQDKPNNNTIPTDFNASQIAEFLAITHSEADVSEGFRVIPPSAQHEYILTKTHNDSSLMVRLVRRGNPNQTFTHKEIAIDVTNFIPVLEQEKKLTAEAFERAIKQCTKRIFFTPTQ